MILKTMCHLKLRIKLLIKRKIGNCSAASAAAMLQCLNHVCFVLLVWLFPFSNPSSGQSSLFPMEDGFLDDGRGDQTLHSGLGSPHCFSHQNGERVERYSRKVFVGGLPPDIDEGTPRKSPSVVL